MRTVFANEMTEGFVKQWRDVHALFVKGDERVSERHVQITAYDAINTAREQEENILQYVTENELEVMEVYARVYRQLVTGMYTWHDLEREFAEVLKLEGAVGPYDIRERLRAARFLVLESGRCNDQEHEMADPLGLEPAESIEHIDPVLRVLATKLYWLI